jgi:hypothetical protein
MTTSRKIIVKSTRKTSQPHGWLVALFSIALVFLGTSRRIFDSGRCDDVTVGGKAFARRKEDKKRGNTPSKQQNQTRYI